MRVSSPSIIVAESLATPKLLGTPLGGSNHGHDGRGGNYLGKKARAEHGESGDASDIVAHYMLHISKWRESHWRSHFLVN
jgi:hypothetical protein